MFCCVEKAKFDLAGKVGIPHTDHARSKKMLPAR